MKVLTSANRPKDLTDLKNMIAARSIVFSSQSERVARVALEKPEIVAFGTLQSIAAECCVAPTTVFRVAKMAGFQNFIEFQRLFRQYFMTASPAAARKKLPLE